MDEIVTNMLKLDIIRPSTSAWAAGPLLVRKGADYRMCINYVPLNSHTKRINWPSPDIGDITDALAGCSIYLTCDLTKAFHQWEVVEEH